jgi:hypothetical protein
MKKSSWYKNWMRDSEEFKTEREKQADQSEKWRQEDEDKRRFALLRAAPRMAEESGRTQADWLREQLDVAEKANNPHELGTSKVFVEGVGDVYAGDIKALMRKKGFAYAPEQPDIKSQVAGVGDKKLGASGTPTEGAKTQMNFPNARFDITQNFAEGFDPDRIIAAFGTDLAQLGETKVSSGLMPLGAAF